MENVLLAFLTWRAGHAARQNGFIRSQAQRLHAIMAGEVLD